MPFTEANYRDEPGNNSTLRQIKSQYDRMKSRWAERDKRMQDAERAGLFDKLIHAAAVIRKVPNLILNRSLMALLNKVIRADCQKQSPGSPNIISLLD